jgi:hypothetical protein
MRRWRCTNPSCKQSERGLACLVFAQDRQRCRTLNAEILGRWDAAIKDGRATIDAFPAGMLPPPFAGEVQHGKKRSHSDSPPSNAMPMPTQVFNFGMGFNGPPAPQEHAPQRQASSPPLRSRQIPGITTPQVLDNFFQWYMTLPENQDVGAVQAVEKAFGKLRVERFNLATMLSLEKADWKEMGVPMGLGMGLIDAAREFVKTHMGGM